MSINLDPIDTVVILMMENRSFDHMLGYLSLAHYAGDYPGSKEVDGLRDDQNWLNKVANEYQGAKYWPQPLKEARIPDPPHERNFIKWQMGPLDPAGNFPLDGFVLSAGGDSEVMNYQTPEAVAILDFFARNFRICDRWFSCLPASTQPNRLIAMSGYTLIDGNKSVLPNQTLVYDWLNAQGIRWRVYHQGLFPFLTLMPRWAPATLGENFRSFDRYAIDMEHEPDSTFPQVIFVEPIYNDAPHLEAEGTDDHSPSSVYGGQCLMHDVYAAMVASRHWECSALIITYDEHGGFFDHSQPIKVETAAPDDRYPVFETSGLRVPAVIVSPFASAGSVCHTDMDHTSVLKFLGQKFGMGGGYSPEVDRRKVGSLATVFDLLNSARKSAPPPPPLSAIKRQPSTVPVPVPNANETVNAFNQALANMKKNHAHQLLTKFPSLRAFFGI
jgi:phospholipase C